MSTTATNNGRPFWAAFIGFPGCLSEGDGPPTVHGSYRDAAEEIAETLDRAADGYEEGDEEGDRYEALAKQARASTEEEGFAETGPDGLRYTVETIDPRGVWTASDRDGSDGFPDVLLSYGPASDSDTTAEEAAEEVSSVCGSMIEVEESRGPGFGLAYVLVDSTRLREAAGEFRESGFLLVDEHGDEIDPEGPEDLGPDVEEIAETIAAGGDTEEAARFLADAQPETAENIRQTDAAILDAIREDVPPLSGEARDFRLRALREEVVRLLRSVEDREDRDDRARDFARDLLAGLGGETRIPDRTRLDADREAETVRVHRHGEAVAFHVNGPEPTPTVYLSPDTARTLAAVLDRYGRDVYRVRFSASTLGTVNVTADGGTTDDLGNPVPRP